MPIRWLSGVLIAAGVWAGTLAAQEKDRPRAGGLLRQFNSSVETVVRRVSPSVVEVRVSGYGPVDDGKRGETGLVIGKQHSLGSGVIWDPEGYIVTNAHVVLGAKRVQVVLPARVAEGTTPGIRGRTVEARVVGVTKEIDLALLKVDARNLPALPISNDVDIRQGGVVFAFGSPQGLQNSVTMGVISATARQHEPENPMIYIQTDAPINPGSSGGPLVDVDGRLVGINTFIVTEGGGNEGIGFAIPGSVVSFVCAQLKKYGEVRRGEIGAGAQNITPELAEGLGLSRDWGVVVSDVVPGGSAETAGLRIQDVLVSVDGQPIESLPALGTALYLHVPGEHLRLEVLRAKKMLAFDVLVVEAPRPKDLIEDLVDPEHGLIRRLGVLAVEIDSRVKRILPELRGPGIVVAAKAAGVGPSANPLAPGDVVHAVNRIPVTSLRQMRAALEQLPFDSSVVLQVEREGRLLYLICPVE